MRNHKHLKHNNSYIMWFENVVANKILNTFSEIIQNIKSNNEWTLMRTPEVTIQVLTFKKLLRNGLHRQCIGFYKTRKILFKQKSKLTQSQNVPKV